MVRTTNSGNTATVVWADQNYRAQTNDRINFTIMREIPGQFKVDATWFMNYRTARSAQSAVMNLADPKLGYTYKAQLSQNIANPFYNYLTPEMFPGPHRNQATGYEGKSAAAVSAIRRPSYQ